MADDATNHAYDSFLGRGWSFPPEFRLLRDAATDGGVRLRGEVAMRADEDDIAESLRILFGTTVGERFLNPSYGLDVQALQFEPLTTTLRTFLKDRIKNAILIHEPRITVLTLDVYSPDPNAGTLALVLEYEIRATNSRFNLVFPFYQSDSNEVGTPAAG